MLFVPEKLFRKKLMKSQNKDSEMKIHKITENILSKFDFVYCLRISNTIKFS